MRLQKTRHDATDLFALFMDLLHQSEAVNRMDQGDKRGNEFDLVALQMADHVPGYVLWKDFVFAGHFLNFVFAENTLSRLVCFQQFFRRVGLSDSDQPAPQTGYLAIK